VLCILSAVFQLRVFLYVLCAFVILNKDYLCVIDQLAGWLVVCTVAVRICSTAVHSQWLAFILRISRAHWPLDCHRRRSGRYIRLSGRPQGASEHVTSAACLLTFRQKMKSHLFR